VKVKHHPALIAVGDAGGFQIVPEHLGALFRWNPPGGGVKGPEMSSRFGLSPGSAVIGLSPSVVRAIGSTFSSSQAECPFPSDSRPDTRSQLRTTEILPDASRWTIGLNAL
jgi:hypothetical protein